MKNAIDMYADALKAALISADTETIQTIQVRRNNLAQMLDKYLSDSLRIVRTAHYYDDITRQERETVLTRFICQCRNERTTPQQLLDIYTVEALDELPF